MNNTYKVCITIYNSFDVVAGNADQAEQEVREMSIQDIINDCDFNIVDVEKEPTP